MTSQPRDAPQFYLTSPSSCPYLPGREERKVFTHIIGKRARDLNEILTQGGFRRSQTIAYRPACDSCRSCVSVRVVTGEFEPTANMRRVLRDNRDIIGMACPNRPSPEQYVLFRRYLDSRHRHGGMTDMTVLDYSMMIEDSHVETQVVEYRRGDPGHPEGGPLVAVSLTDRMSDGLSMVYSFFDPAEARRSLGTYMILDHIARARAAGLAYLYLGYWVEGSKKMDYKARFLPQERLLPAGWARLE